MKFEPGLERARIVALSGQADDATRARALESGCAEFYVKPLAPDALEQLISK